jgi:hypothetical protein
MPTLTELWPKEQTALTDCVRATLRRCKDGYRAKEGAAVHSKRIVNRLARAGLVEVSEDQRAATATQLGYEVAGLAGLDHAA